MTASASSSPELREIPRARRVAGTVTPPSSKSVSHRCFDLALLAGAPITIERPLVAEDTRLFLAALETCGFAVRPDGDVVHLEPRGETGGGEIFCGNAGTMFRFLVAALTAIPGRWRLDGTERLRERPVGPLLATLRQLGASIACPRQEGYAPLDIAGGSLRGGTATLDAGESSQYLSAVLLAALKAPAPTTVEVLALTSAPYLELSLEAARRFGGVIERTADGFFHVEPGLAPPSRVRVEADYSAACYPAAAAALAGGEVVLEGLAPDSRQGDRGFFDLLRRMGVPLAWDDRDGAAVAVVGRGRLEAVEADLSSMPDQVPTLAALAPFAHGVTRIRGVPHLRIKESDRLAAMATELGKLGVPVEELADGLIIPGVWAGGVPSGLPPVTVDTWDDHRIAMSLALVGLRRGGVTLRDPHVVAKSYPDFWRDLGELVEA
ncbi:MAG: 3-phosphoshikimate 1-carboxyvinyltransferase [Acidobacteria bacterium]|nr:3-phosphoshikimate 1-carboxyvinyltransferase [Acidobacteriota bacterium]